MPHPELVRGEGHVYRLHGKVVPGVTQVLEQINELDGIPRAVLEAAAEFGDHVHQATDLHDRGLLDRSALDPKLEPYLAAWEKFLVESACRVLSSEEMIYHPALRFAGQRDRRVLFKDSTLPHVLDIKTSAFVPRTVGLQTSAYAECDKASGRDTSMVRYCAHLRPDGSYSLIRLQDRRDFSIFVSCLNLWRWRNDAGTKRR